MVEQKIIAYKGFDRNLCCRGFQYEVGKEYEHAGNVVCRESGFHACTNPFDVLGYYLPHEGSRFCEVEQSGVIKLSDTDSIRSSSKIKIIREISLNELAKAAVLWLEYKLSPNNYEEIEKIRERTNNKSCSQINSTKDGVYFGIDNWCADFQINSVGDWVKIGSRGPASTINSNGSFNKISSSGSYVHIDSVGYRTQIGSSKLGATINFRGDYVKVCSIGDGPYIGSVGYGSVILSTGYAPKINATGRHSMIYSAGRNARISADGDDVVISSSGDNSLILSSGGGRHKIESTGLNSIICCTARDSIVKAKVGSWITLSEWQYSCENYCNIPICTKTEYVDGKRIKGGTWYKLINGKFVKQLKQIL